MEFRGRNNITTYDIEALCLQVVSNVRPYEPCGPGNEHLHLARTLLDTRLFTASSISTPLGVREITFEDIVSGLEFVMQEPATRKPEGERSIEDDGCEGIAGSLWCPLE